MKLLPLSPDRANDVPLQCPQCLAPRLAFAYPPFQVALRLRRAARLRHRFANDALLAAYAGEEIDATDHREGVNRAAANSRISSAGVCLREPQTLGESPDGCRAVLLGRGRLSRHIPLQRLEAFLRPEGWQVARDLGISRETLYQYLRVAP